MKIYVKKIQFTEFLTKYYESDFQNFHNCGNSGHCKRILGDLSQAEQIWSNQHFVQGFGTKQKTYNYSCLGNKINAVLLKCLKKPQIIEHKCNNMF